MENENFCYEWDLFGEDGEKKNLVTGRIIKDRFMGVFVYLFVWTPVRFMGRGKYIFSFEN